VIKHFYIVVEPNVDLPEECIPHEHNFIMAEENRIAKVKANDPICAGIAENPTGPVPVVFFPRGCQPVGGIELFGLVDSFQNSPDANQSA
jgi:hypothetical protein